MLHAVDCRHEYASVKSYLEPYLYPLAQQGGPGLRVVAGLVFVDTPPYYYIENGGRTRDMNREGIMDHLFSDHTA